MSILRTKFNRTSAYLTVISLSFLISLSAVIYIYTLLKYNY